MELSKQDVYRIKKTDECKLAQPGYQKAALQAGEKCFVLEDDFRLLSPVPKPGCPSIALMKIADTESSAILVTNAIWQEFIESKRLDKDKYIEWDGCEQAWKKRGSLNEIKSLSANYNNEPSYITDNPFHAMHLTGIFRTYNVMTRQVGEPMKYKPQTGMAHKVKDIVYKLPATKDWAVTAVLSEFVSGSKPYLKDAKVENIPTVAYRLAELLAEKEVETEEVVKKITDMPQIFQLFIHPAEVKLCNLIMKRIRESGDFEDILLGQL